MEKVLYPDRVVNYLYVFVLYVLLWTLLATDTGAEILTRLIF
jgi:hypothetical protein